VEERERESERKKIEKGSELHVSESGCCVRSEVPKVANRQSKRRMDVDPEGGESGTTKSKITRETSV
jgi:hypothetical protein